MANEDALSESIHINGSLLGFPSGTDGQGERERNRGPDGTRPRERASDHLLLQALRCIYYIVHQLAR